MRILPLASSSRGNACLVEHAGRALLIDCGISLRSLKTRLAAAWGEGIDLSWLDGVLITHNHTDHISGLHTLVDKSSVAIYANLMTAEATAAATGLELENFVIFENRQTFTIGAFEVSPFSIPHDAADPVGYQIRAGGTVCFHATDIGTPLASIGERLATADFAVLESNHDPVMLAQSRRPEELKRRISGPRGHLANDEAAELAATYASPRLKAIHLAHLSHECNAPHLALASMHSALAGIGRSDIRVEVANA